MDTFKIIADINGKEIRLAFSVTEENYKEQLLTKLYDTLKTLGENIKSIKGF